MNSFSTNSIARVSTNWNQLLFPIFSFSRPQISAFYWHPPIYHVPRVIRRRGRHVFCTFSLEKGNNENNMLMKTEIFDFDDADVEEMNSEDEDYEEDLPLGYMQKWYKNKPPGFGEGREYDTSIEDRLVDEMEQSRQAQFANINKLKNNPTRSRIKNTQLPAQKVPELFSNGVHVRVSNLPKKKNVHRDLRTVFNDFSGLINIQPAVSGTKKTRDPICKGFATVHLKSMEDAIRFIQTFSDQSITFGRIQRQIKCEMLSPTIPDSATCKSAIGSNSSSERVETRSDVVVQQTGFDQNLTKEDKSVKPSGLDSELVLEDSGKNAEPSYSVEKKNVAIRKKKTVNMRAKKISKLSILGSAVRLKVRDKSCLLGALSKYGANRVVSNTIGT